MDQPVGNAAINHVPRQMIEAEVLEVCRMADYQGALKVIISIPKGVELAEKTFKPTPWNCWRHLCAWHKWCSRANEQSGAS